MITAIITDMKGEFLMTAAKEAPFLCKRLKELREKNGYTMAEMAKKLGEINFGVVNKSTISRVEAGKTSERLLLEFAEKYCLAFGMSNEQTEQFLRGEKIAVPDTSALMKNSQLIDELNREYNKVIVPGVVIEELSRFKNRNIRNQGRKAWEVIRSISYGDRTISMDYQGDGSPKNDCKIIYIARKASELYHCKVDILTDDTDYSAYLKGDETVSALHLKEYMAKKQVLLDMTKLIKINACFAESYKDFEPLTQGEANAYLPDGNTLIISAVRNRKRSFRVRKEKIKWLIAQGADIDQRDCNRRYFPPLSHAIQVGDYEMFLFLLKECRANPNVGSRNPHSAGKLRQRNEGNMPLMVAAWEGKTRFVEELCKDKRISINQQDANGFTALIKACANGNSGCRDILLSAGADKKIVDIEGKTAADHYKECQKSGSMRTRYQRDSNRRGNGKR